MGEGDTCELDPCLSGSFVCWLSRPQSETSCQKVLNLLLLGSLFKNSMLDCRFHLTVQIFPLWKRLLDCKISSTSWDCLESLHLQLVINVGNGTINYIVRPFFDNTELEKFVTDYHTWEALMGLLQNGSVISDWKITEVVEIQPFTGSLRVP